MADQQLNEKQLQALLRIKRYEQPPPGYFDGLISAVQRRQREEMLRRPAWRLFFERMGVFFASLRKDWSYVGSMACIVMIGVGVIQMVLPRRVPVQQPAMANVRAQSEPLFTGLSFPEEVATIDPRDLVLRRNENLQPVNTPRTKQRSPAFPVHYFFDTHPSNHEPPTRVRF